MIDFKLSATLFENVWQVKFRTDQNIKKKDFIRPPTDGLWFSTKIQISNVHHKKNVYWQDSYTRFNNLI